eukprot:746688-Hanusia_phi.AAC.1
MSEWMCTPTETRSSRSRGAFRYKYLPDSLRRVELPQWAWGLQEAQQRKALQACKVPILQKAGWCAQSESRCSPRRGKISKKRKTGLSGAEWHDSLCVMRSSRNPASFLAQRWYTCDEAQASKNGLLVPAADCLVVITGCHNRQTKQYDQLNSFACCSTLHKQIYGRISTPLRLSEKARINGVAISTVT